MSEYFFNEMEMDVGRRSWPTLAYVKVINLNEARALGAVIPSDIVLKPNAKLYALHAGDGTTVTITNCRAAAYGAAVRNNYVPLSVH